MTGPPPSGQPQSSPKRPPRPPARPAKQDTDAAAVASSTENGSHSSTAAAWDGSVLKSENDSYKFVNIASDAVPPAAAPNGGFVPRKKLSSFTSEVRSPACFAKDHAGTHQSKSQATRMFALAHCHMAAVLCSSRQLPSQPIADGLLHSSLHPPANFIPYLAHNHMHMHTHQPTAALRSPPRPCC